MLAGQRFKGVPEDWDITTRSPFGLYLGPPIQNTGGTTGGTSTNGGGSSSGSSSSGGSSGSSGGTGNGGSVPVPAQSGEADFLFVALLAVKAISVLVDSW